MVTIVPARPMSLSHDPTLKGLISPLVLERIDVANNGAYNNAVSIANSVSSVDSLANSQQARVTMMEQRLNKVEEGLKAIEGLLEELAQSAKGGW